MNLITSEFTEEGKKIAYQFENISQKKGCIAMPDVVGISYKEGNEFKYIPVLISDSIKNLLNVIDPKKQPGEIKKAYITEGDKIAAKILAGSRQSRSSLRKDGLKEESEYQGSWNELKTKDFIDEIATFNPEEGDIRGPIITALALSRKVGEKNQKIMILGDADCFSNGEFSGSRKEIKAQNFSMATGMFFWLSDNEVPIDVRRPENPDTMIYTKRSQLIFLNTFYKIVIPSLLALFFLFIWLRRKRR